MEAEERRNLPRYLINISVAIQTKNERHSATMTDIGFSGAALITRTYFRPRSEIEIIPDFNQSYRLKGWIVWVKEIQNPQCVRYSFGVDIDLIAYKEKIAKSFSERKDLVKKLILKAKKYNAVNDSEEIIIDSILSNI